MKRLILFSLPTEKVKRSIESALFPEEIEYKKMAYMPAEGSLTREKYLAYEAQWKQWCKSKNTEFEVILNDAKDIQSEIDKLNDCNILLVTGGNAYQLLKNLKVSGMYNALKDFFLKDDFVYAGFSAGAMLVTPTMRLADFDSFEENKEVKFNDDSCLGMIDFELFPHYDESIYSGTLKRYQIFSKNKVVTLTDEEYLILDLS